MFDFNKHYKNMSVDTDALIDLSNLPIKSDSSASVLDDNGQPYDVTLNETVTKNIDYVVTEVNVPDLTVCTGSESDINEGHAVKNIILDIVGNDESEEIASGKEDDTYAFRRYSSLDDADYYVIDQNGNEVSSVPGTAFVYSNNIAYPYPISLSITPKYKLLARTFPIADNADTYSHTLAMFGLFGTGCETYKWAKDSSKYKDKNCVLRYSTLESRIEKLQEKLEGTGFELETTTYYELPDPNDSSENPADISKPDSGTVKDDMSPQFVVESGNTAGFCTKMANYNYMSNCDGDNATPFLPSIRDAFEAYYYKKEDMVDEFNENFDEVIYNIKKLWRFKRYLKSSTRDKINKVCQSEYQYASAAEINLSAENNENHQWLVDLESLLCVSKGSKKLCTPRLIYPFAKVNVCMRSAIESISNEPGYILQTDVVYNIHKISYVPVKPQSLSSDFLSVFSENALYSYTEMSLSEVLDYIVNLYDNYIVQTIYPDYNSQYASKYFVDGLRNQYITYVINMVISSLTMPLAMIQQSYYENPLTFGYSSTVDSIKEELASSKYSSYRVRIISWQNNAEVNDEGICQGTNRDTLIPALEGGTAIASANVCDKLAIVDDVDDVISKFNMAIAALAITGSYVMAAALKLLLIKLERSVDSFDRIVNRIKYFEYYTADSVFPSKERILTDSQCYYTSNGKPISITLPARFLVPTKLYRKIKVKRKILGFTRTYTKNICIGIRWTEIKFINVGLYDRYPKNLSIPTTHVDFKTTLTILGNSGTTLDPIPQIVNDDDNINIMLDGGVAVSCKVVDRYNVTFTSQYVAGAYQTSYIEKGLDNTKTTDERTKVTVNYMMPHLPYDDELRLYALKEYGPFDQSVNAEIERGSTKYNEYDGWQIFYESTHNLKDLRKGINIYPSVAYLLKILKDTFGNERVQLCDTIRSMDDQERLCLGGSESAFLSWHNYGLAVKILIYQEDLKTPIESNGDDMKTLIKVAKKFTTDSLNGVYGAYFNVVWCGRLKVGANIFDWEFLPIGVNHKDAYLFRDSMIQQRDPILDLSYVDATDYLVKTAPKSTTSKAWITTDSNAYTNGITCNGKVFVNPKMIRNFPFQKNLVLINLIEFFKLVRLKMSAYGDKLPDNDDMYSWMCKNRISYNQLLIYFGLIGNLKSAKSLLAGEYALRFKPILDTYYNTDAIDFVKNYLGDMYDYAKVVIADSKDASYISLKDGKLHVPCQDGRPNLPLSADNLFDQKQVSKDNYELGVWKDGRFIPATKDMEYVSSSSVISGYSNGEPVGGDAYMLHSIVADQIKSELEYIIKQFESYSGSLMFDTLTNGPNADKFEYLENEFGLISAQDLVDFDTLYGIVEKEQITDDILNDKDIYEKVVSNAQENGMRLASLSSEHIEIDEPVSEGMTVQDFVKLIDYGKAPTANDLMKG